MKAILWSLILVANLSYLIYELALKYKIHFELKKGSARSIRWISNSKLIESKLDEWVSQRNKKAIDFIQWADELLKNSRIRISGKPLNKYVFFLVLIIIATFAGVFSGIKLNNPVAGILILIVVGYLHFHFLSWDSHYRKRKIRKQTPNFFLTLLNFYEVHHDINLALRDTAAKIKNPIKTDMLYLLAQLQNSGDFSLRDIIVDAKQKLDNKLLQDFLDDLELQIRYGGHFSSTIQNYINDSIEKEIRIMERSSETAGASMVTYFLMGVFFMLAFSMSKTQPQAMHMLVTHIAGKITVVAIIIIMLIVLYVTKEMTQIDED